jgi:hypothetical protein
VRPYWILDYANPCYPGTIWPACNTAACIAGYGKNFRFVIVCKSTCISAHIEGCCR